MTSHKREFLSAHPCQHLALASSQPRWYTSLSQWCYVCKFLWHKCLCSLSGHFFFLFFSFAILASPLMRDLFTSLPKFLIRWLVFLLLSGKNSLFISGPSRLAHICHMETSWLAHMCHRETSWLGHSCGMKRSWLAYICHIDTSQLARTRMSHGYFNSLFVLLAKSLKEQTSVVLCVCMYSHGHTQVHICACVHVFLEDTG